MNAILDNKKSSIQSYLVLLRYNPSNESCRHLHRKLAMHATVVSGASAPILVAAILFFVIAAVQDMSVQVQAGDHSPPQFPDTPPSRNFDASMRRLTKAFSILMGLSLLGPMSLSLSAKRYTVNADTRRNANKEKFDRAVSAIDDLLGATRSNDLEVTHLFVGILPESDRIKDHLRFFQGLDSKPNRAHLNHKDFIYF